VAKDILNALRAVKKWGKQVSVVSADRVGKDAELKTLFILERAESPKPASGERIELGVVISLSDQ
jgi:hypothetical protein